MLDFTRLMLISTQVEVGVEVGVELGKKPKQKVMDCLLLIVSCTNKLNQKIKRIK